MTSPSVNWREEAEADLLEITGRIAEDNPYAARSLGDEIKAKTARLPQHPYLYRKSQKVDGMREIVVRSEYIIHYVILPHQIDIVNVIHTRRQWPR